MVRPVELVCVYASRRFTELCRQVDALRLRDIGTAQRATVTARSTVGAGQHMRTW